MELFEQIRKDYHQRDKSIRRIARERRIHRRTVRMALASAIPPTRQSSGRPCKVLTPAYRLIIDQWMLQDKQAPRKQRHTGQRLFERLRDEHHYTGSASTVQHYVSGVRKELGAIKQVFIPQHHAPGEEAEVDWYEAMLDVDSVRMKVYFFQMRACCSGREFHMAFMRQTQQAFLEAHVAAFRYFGGVFKRIRYDNLTAAVKKVLRGRKRIQTDRFIALRSHYLFDAEFCLPGIQGAHEKGGVEGGVGRFRRAHLVPVPQVRDINTLNAHLLQACEQDDQRTIRGRQDPVIARWQQEIPHLQALPTKVFETFLTTQPVVNRKSLVTVKGNHYSVPVMYVGQTVEARIHAESIELLKQGKCVARHSRCYDQHQMIASLDHYLSLLRYKPGALPGAAALHQAKRQDTWPQAYEQYWQSLITQHGRGEANRKMVDFLWWAKDHERQCLVPVLTQAMACGCGTLDGIQLLMRQSQQKESVSPPLQLAALGELSQFERPVGNLTQYDRLLSVTGGVR